MPVTTIYNRSEILSFFDLDEAQKNDVLDCYYQTQEDAENDSFVIFKSKKSECALPLSMFIRTGKCKIWDGVYGTSYFSAYFIKLSKCGSMAVVAEKYN